MTFRQNWGEDRVWFHDKTAACSRCQRVGPMLLRWMHSSSWLRVALCFDWWTCSNWRNASRRRAGTAGERCKGKDVVSVKKMLSIRQRAVAGIMADSCVIRCAMCTHLADRNRLTTHNTVHNCLYSSLRVRFRNTSMPRTHKDTDKQKALRQHGTLNPRPQDVATSSVPGQRFLRPGRHGSGQVRDAPPGPCRQTASFPGGHEFGFSRPSFYQASRAFEQSWLVRAGSAETRPQKRSQTHAGSDGVRPRKANIEIRRSASFQLAELVKTDFNVQVHPRSIERQLLREKKRR